MGLRKKIIKKLCEYLLNKNIFTSKKTPNNKVRELLSLIKPRKLNIDHVRIGGNNDGGYLVPNDLKGINYCFSPGVGNIAKFEEEISQRNIKSFLADYSVNFKSNNPLINFEKKFLGPISNDNYISLKDWLVSKIDYENEKDIILQLDVEGDEYDIINSIDLETLKKIRILLIEFHNMHYILDEFYYIKILKTFSLLSKYFYCSHIHPNNDVDFVIQSKDIIIPPVLEFSFIRKDRVNVIENTLSFPHKLDQPNNLNKRDIILPDCWFK